MSPRCLLAAFLLVPGAWGQQETTGSDELLSQGRELYVQNCARCHGPEGRGNGTTQVFPPPRNFQEGGFSFGNTEEAVMRTIAEGIPGTAMTPYRDVLDKAQRRALAQYVLSLVPEAARRQAGAATLVVQDRPLVVRGYLSCPRPDQKNWPRGVVLGVPGGFSFAYRVGDVRLLGVRRGPFVRRTDWSGRGGTPLRLLGRVFHRSLEGDPPPAFSLVGPWGDRDLRAVLRGTFAREEACGLSYRLLDGEDAVAEVKELQHVALVREASGFRRTWIVRALGGARTLALRACFLASGQTWMEGRPREEECTPVGGLPAAALLPPAWLVAAREDGSYDVVRVAAPESTRLLNLADRVRLLLHPDGRDPLRVELSMVRTPEWNEQVFDRLDSDLDI